MVASYNGSQSLIADYVYGLGLESQAGPGGTGYYDSTGSGNTVGITGSSGSYVNQYTVTCRSARPRPSRPRCRTHSHSPASSA